MTNSAGQAKPCPLCNDDGYVETWVEHLDFDGASMGEEPVQRECPYLNEPGHAPFNSTGILPRRMVGGV